MHFEIEKKFPVASFDGLPEKLVRLGASPGDVVEQVDRYYQHPQRDFAKTDEAFRLRRVGDQSCLTYKGPKFDAETKTRVEEEVDLAAGVLAAETCHRLICRLGFEPVTEVRKTRTSYHMSLGEHSIEIALDEVEHVGEYVEIEATVDADAADDPMVETAKNAVSHIAEQLGLKQTERRSYLQLLLDRSAQ